MEPILPYERGRNANHWWYVCLCYCLADVDEPRGHLAKLPPVAHVDADGQVPRLNPPERRQGNALPSYV